MRFPDGNRALTDMYFPQFGVYLEINEIYHLKNEEADKYRSQRIFSVTQFQQENIPECALVVFDRKIDEFIDKINKLKKQAVKKESFEPWDYEGQYNPQKHIKRGYISLDSGAVFRTHKDALQCFGYDKGDYQRSIWKVPNTDYIVWFPKLYDNNYWKNELSVDGGLISVENSQSEISERGRASDLEKRRIVFAHETDPLGKTLYRYKGVFKYDHKNSSSRKAIYFKIEDKIDL